MARTVPSPTLQNPGNFVTGALWNAGPKVTGDFFTAPPMFRGRQSSTQSTSSGVFTAMNINVEDIDTDNGHATNSAQYVSQVAGWYWVEGYVAWTNLLGGFRMDGALFKNATILLGTQQSFSKPGAEYSAISASAIVFLAVGDSVDMRGRQNTGSTLSTFVGSDLAPALNVLWVHS